MDFRDYIATHYALMPEDEARGFKRNRFAKDNGITILTYQPSTGHPEVVEFLKDLSAQVQEHQNQARLEVRSVTPVERLAQEVTEWLSAIGYQVNREVASNDQLLCFTAGLEQGSVSQRVRVHCIGGEIRAFHIEDMDASLNRRTNQGWAICDQRVSPQAAARATELDGVETYRLADFLRQKVWGPYISVLEALVLEPKIPERYVDPACHKQEMDTEGRAGPTEDMGCLDAYMDRWITERGKVHMSLLGEFGTGKTWFCRHYAWRRLQRYLEDPVGERLPLLVTLREFIKTTSPEQLINDLLLERYRLPFVGSAFEVFRQMNRCGKLLLILDGFDEMARKADYQTVVDNFWELAKLVEDESKVVLTSRTEYFRWARESEKVLAGQEYGRRTIELEPPRFEVLYLTAFDDERIRRMIIARLGEEKGGPTADKVLAHHSLKEMARKPVLTDLLLSAIDEAGIEALERESDIYLKATNRLLLRNIDTARTFTSTADKVYFLCELAWEMLRDGKLQVHYKEIPERIRRWFGGRIEEDRELDCWDYDLRNQTLLHRDAAGYYEFAHKSLAEFFVAVKFAAELGGLHENVLSTYREVQGQPNRSLEHESRLDQLVQTFGFFASRNERIKAAWNFLPWILDPKRVKKRLVEIILSCRNRHAADCGFVAGNALTLLQEFGLATAPDGKTFRGTDLSFLPLAHARFSPFHSADMSNASLKSSDLSYSEIPLPIFQEADLGNANCKRLRLGGRGSNTRTWARGFEGVLGATRVIHDVENGIPILSLHWHPDGNLFAGAMDGTIREWQDGMGEESCHCSGIPFWVECVRRHWQDSNGWIIWYREGVFSLDSQGNRRKLVAPVSGTPGFLSAIDNGGQHLPSWKDEGALALYDLDSEQELLSTGGGLTNICAVDLSHASGTYAAGTTNSHLLVWKDLNKSATTHLLKQGVAISALHISDSEHTLFAAGLEERGNLYYLNLWAWDLNAEKVLWHRCDPVFNRRAFGIEINERITLRHNKAEGLLSVATGDMDVPVRLMEAATGSPVFNLRECPAAQTVTFNPQKPELAIGHDHGSVSIWDCDRSSATFATCLRILDVRLNAQGARISGATGLDETIVWTRQWKQIQGTRLEFLADCGAILDEEQQRVLAHQQSLPRKSR